ncbi:hypothetical protein [Paenibacillus sp. UNC496MF]|uniref:hypothetical protein n=1 Tax=Paenibacillus sp. UNC496MF TaxID=1502753 RepID=UPI0015A6AA67|nr:hypothetical protein [Paenibacillus sp. UNC496MF]
MKPEARVFVGDGGSPVLEGAERPAERTAALPGRLNPVPPVRHNADKSHLPTS